MLRVAAIAAQVLVLSLVAYTVVTALPGWRNQPAPSPGLRRRRFRVVVPAHDEATVIADLLVDLAAQSYPGDLFAVHVVADHCHDGTAAIARNEGAVVSEREVGDGGKGAALAWYLERHPLGEDVLVVLDADNRVPPDLLVRLDDALSAGAEAVQAYLDTVNPVGSPLATAAALSYWAGNRMVQLARSNLGWPADLGGTGMAITASALEAAGGFTSGLAEDQDLGVRLALAGHPVFWLHGVRVRDEKPERVGVALRQRARWTAGRRGAARRHVAALLAAAVRRRSPGLFDQAVRLLQPGRSFVALVTAVLAVAAAVAGSDWLLPWPIWAVAAAVQFLLPIPFLARDGVPARYLARYPLLVLIALLWLPIRVLSRFTRRWYHTPHRGR